MSLNVSALTKYTDELSGKLISEAVLKGKTVDLVSVQPNVKYSATINKMTTDVVAAAGGCGWSATGSTTLSQRTISVDDIKVNEAICLSDLDEYYVSTMLNAGSYNEEIPFEEIYSNLKVEKLKGLIEDLVWKGNKDTGSGNLALANGLIKVFDASTSTLGATGSYTAGSFSGTTAIDLVDEIVLNTPTNIINANDLVLFVGYAEYRAYAKALRDANLFHYTGTEGNDFEMMIPGTNVKMVAVRGLNSQNKMVLTQASNIVVGTDLLDDATSFRIWYSQDNDEVRFLSKFKIGAQVAFIENVVYYTGS